MTKQTQRDWRELCAAVVSENDPKKFELLIEELTQALDELDNSALFKLVSNESESRTRMPVPPTE